MNFFGWLFLFLLRFWQNFFLLSKLFFVGKIFYLAELHLANFIPRYFILRTSLAETLFGKKSHCVDWLRQKSFCISQILSLASPGSPLATPMAFLAKDKNYIANTQTNYIEILYRYSCGILNFSLTQIAILTELFIFMCIHWDHFSSART